MHQSQILGLKKNRSFPVGAVLLLALMVSANATIQKKIKLYQHLLKHTNSALFSTSHSSPNLFSNANNFKSALQSTVDPRTGTLSCAMVVGQLNSNWSKGPFYKLTLHYTGSASKNSDGIGNGWQWNLPHYNLKTHTLTTRRGRTFLLIKKADGTWKFRYHKLKDAVIAGSPHTGWTLTLKTGIREYFSPQGDITKMEAETGDAITFHYMHESNKALLTYIADENGHKIKIKRAFGIIKVSSLDSKGQPLIMTITTSNNKVHSVIFPTPITSSTAQTKNAKDENHAISFTYVHQFITKINYPTGAEDDYQYSFQTGAKEMLRLQANGTVTNVPVIIQHIQKPNAGTMQGASIITYKYGSANSNHHDYLAFGSQQPAIPNPNHDVLFDTRASYTYQTVVDNGQIKDVRTYNKYHLMIKNVKINDHTNQQLSETQNYYCNPNDLSACNHLTFAQLPAAYTLPLKVVQKVWSQLSPAEKPMVLISQARYDNEGNTRATTDYYGRTSHVIYCPIKGDISCPAAPVGWPFINLIESTVYTGAPKNQLGITYHDHHVLSKANAPIILHNTYEKIPNRLGKNYYLKLKEKQLSFGKKTVSTHYEYFLNKHDARTYGMQKTEHTINAPTEATLFSGIHTFGINEINVNVNYLHTKNGLSASTGTITNALNPTAHPHMLPITIRSAYTGALLEKITADQTSSTTYRYDRWNRLITASLYDGRAGTAHAKLIRRSTVRYVVSPNLNEKITVNADGSQEKIIYDGLGRPIATYGQASHNGRLLPIMNENGTTRADGWQRLSTKIYDHYGYLIELKKYLGVDTQGQPIVLDTHKYYNVRGQTTRIVNTDGTATHYLYAENELCTASYVTGKKGHINSVAIANFNPIKKIIRGVTYPEGVVIPNQNNIEKLCQLGDNADHQGLVSTYLYDRFGRLRQIMDPEGHTVTKIYDNQGHLTDIVDPKGNKTHYTYNMLGNITSKTLEPVTGGTYPIAVYKYNVMGQLVEKFIEGAIGQHSTLHPFYRYTYNARGLLVQITTPNGHVVTKRYDDLNRLIEKDIDGLANMTLSYTQYDQIIRRIDSSGTYLFSYNQIGGLTSVHHQGNARYPSYTLHWRYNDYGQVVATTNISGDISYPVLDVWGRTSSIYYLAHNHSSPQLIQHVQYGPLNRPIQLVDGNGLTRKLTYNALGRIKKIQDTINHHVAYTWGMAYDKLGNIVQENTVDSHGNHAIKNYQYDTLSNLTDFACTSRGAANLCPRDTDITHSGLTAPPIIAHQHYTFTAFNTLSSVQEKGYTLTNATHIFNKVTHYHYNSKAYGPLRLKNYMTQWGTQAPVTSHAFVYDNDGNIIVDGKNDHMTYNATDQVLSYTTLQGKTFHYTYDGLNREISEHYNGMTNTLFYTPSGSRLNEQRTQGATMHTIGYFGAMETIDSTPNQYLETNYKGDVIQTWGASSSGHHLLTTNVYSPYGMTYALLKNTAAPLTKNAIGFDGQRTDPGTQWQMLGNGHRAYNPVLRHFMTEDPILEGYTFGSNNPIMNIDPSGNMSKNLTQFLSIFSVMAIGMFNPCLGIAMATTQIGAHAHPHSNAWKHAGTIVSIASSVLIAAAGIVLMFVPFIGVETGIAMGFAVASAVLGVVSTISGGIATGLGIATQFTKDSIRKTLFYISLGFQALAIASGLLGVVMAPFFGGRVFKLCFQGAVEDMEEAAAQTRGSAAVEALEPEPAATPQETEKALPKAIRKASPGIKSKLDDRLNSLPPIEEIKKGRNLLKYLASHQHIDYRDSEGATTLEHYFCGAAFAKYEDIAAASDALASGATKEINVYMQPRNFAGRQPISATSARISILKFDEITAAQLIAEDKHGKSLVLKIPVKSTNVVGHLTATRNGTVTNFQAGL